MSEFLTINAETRIATNTKQFDVPDEIYSAIVVGIANMGEVESTYQGEAKTAKKVSIAFALNYKFANGENAVVTQRYTLSLHEKSTLGKIFAKIGMDKSATLGDLIGKQVRVEIIHKGEYANIGSILAATKTKMETPKVYLPTWWYEANYEMGKAKGVLEGARPKAGTTDIKVRKYGTQEQVTITVPTTELQAPEVANDETQAGDDLPFN